MKPFSSRPSTHGTGHTVLNLGMSEEVQQLVVAAHAEARARKLYPKDCYMASNPDEYWAEGTQVIPDLRETFQSMLRSANGACPPFQTCYSIRHSCQQPISSRLSCLFSPGSTQRLGRTSMGKSPLALAFVHTTLLLPSCYAMPMVTRLGDLHILSPK